VIIKFVQPAPDGEPFAPSAFHSQLGRQIPITIEGHEGHETAMLVSVAVADDGSSAELGVVLNDDEVLMGKVFGDTSLLRS
jgi:hypothetical protein